MLIFLNKLKIFKNSSTCGSCVGEKDAGTLAGARRWARLATGSKVAISDEVVAQLGAAKLVPVVAVATGVAMFE